MTQIEVGGFPADAAGQGCLGGDLASFSAFELLQYLSYLRKSGVLMLVRPDGPAARCSLERGRIAAAQCGHLDDRAAVLTFVWWKSGRFVFEATEAASPGAAAFSVEELLMEAVRIADEVELRHVHVPLSASPLEAAPGAEDVRDDLSCGLQQVVSYLRFHPGVTREEVEAHVPRAPIEIRLALAQLAIAGRLRGNLAGPRGAREPSIAWWKHLTERFPGGVRVLVAHAVSAPAGAIFQAVSRLGEMLEVPDLPMAISPDGPSFVRIRPASGGILSLTLLPMSRKNHYLFETFVSSVQLALIDGSVPRREADAWSSLVPNGVPWMKVEPAALTETETLGRLAELVGAS